MGSAPTSHPERRHPRAGRTASRRPAEPSGARARIRREHGLVGGGSRRGRLVLPANARGHRRRLVLRAHQPVRLPAGRGRRPVRGRADRQGRGGRPRQARRRPAGLRPGAELEGVLRPPHGRGDRGLRRARDEASRTRRDRWRTVARPTGTCAGSGTSTIASSSSWTVESAGSGAQASRTTSRTAASTTSSSASKARWWRSSSSSSWRASAGSAVGSTAAELDALFPSLEGGAEPVPARVLHNAPGRYRPITDAIAHVLDSATETLDVVNPYVTDRGMIRRIERAARRGVRVRLFVPANANNWACAGAQQFHHAKLLDAGVRILEYPTMLHAKVFVRDGARAPGGDVQPRGVEPQALLRDRPPAPVDSRRGPVRGAVQRARRGAVDPGSAPDRDEETGQGRGPRGDLAAALTGDGQRMSLFPALDRRWDPAVTSRRPPGDTGGGHGHRNISAERGRATARSGVTSRR